MPKNIYKGYNPIYEAMASEQNPNKDTNTGADPAQIVTAIYNYIINTLLIPSSDDNLKSIDGFNELAKSFDVSQDFSGLKTTMTNLANKLLTDNTSLDDNGRSQYKEYLESLFNSLMQIPDVNSKLPDVKKVLDELLNSTRDTIKKSASFKTTNENILIEQHGYIKSKSSGADNTSTQSPTTEESDNDDTNYSGKWYVDLANSILDQATAFKSETTEPSLDPKVAGDQQAKDIISKNTDFYNRALDLQIPGKRKGLLGLGKIKTRGGDMKAKDFQIACENLADEIKRARESLNKIKASITKIPAPPIVKNCPAGFTWDSRQNKCVATPKGQSGTKNNKAAGASNTGNNKGNCTFPIPLSMKSCIEVEKLQNHLAQIQCIKETLNRKGGIDGKYGKVTSMVCGIVYGHIKKDDQFPTNSPLTQDMYDALMKFDTGTKTNESAKDLLIKKIFEAECVKNEEILKFSDFDNVLETNIKLIEQVNNQSDIDFICKKITEKFKSVVPVVSGGADKKDNKNKTGKIDTDKPKTSTSPGGDDTIKKFKPMADGKYLIKYDESWGKSISGTLVDTAILTAAAAAAVATGGISIVGGAIIAGVGGATTHALAADKNSIEIAIKGGYIEKIFCEAMAYGLVDTLDGFVSRDDVLAIMQTLCYAKGAFTVIDGKAVSAWKYIKTKYHEKETDEDLSTQAYSWGTGIRDVKNFPNFKQRTEPGTTVSAEIAQNTIKDAVSRLDQNEANFAQWLATLNPEKIKSLENPEEVTGSSKNDSDSKDKEEN